MRRFCADTKFPVGDTALVYMTIKRESNVIYLKSLHEMIETMIDAINVVWIRIPGIEKAPKVQQNPAVNDH